MRSPLPRVWALALLCLAALHGEPVESLITAGDLLKIKRLESPVFSPDGRHIAYVVRDTRADPANPDTCADHSRLWLAATDGGSAFHPLTRADADAGAPCWDPAGSRLAFLQRDATGNRLCVLTLSTNTEETLTPPLANASAPQWSPDGGRLLFTATAPAPAAPKPDAKKPGSSSLPAAPAPDPDGTLAARRAWLARNAAAHNPDVIAAPDANAGNLQASALTHLYTVEIRAGAEPVDLTPGPVAYEDPAWLPDGKTIVCTRPAHPSDPAPAQLVILNADGSDRHTLPMPEGYAPSHPQPSPDGRMIAFAAQPAKDASDLDYGQTRIGLFTPADGKTRFLAEKLDRSVRHLRWSPEGKFIYFTAEANGGWPLYRVPAAGGGTDRLTSPDTGIAGYDIAKNDLALVVSKAGNPGELYRTSPAGRNQRILTSHNGDWLRDKKFATPERRKLKRPDGTEIEYWLARPPYLEGGFNYPLLMILHDGPEAMTGPADPALWFEIQFFAAHGYAVVFGNPRGAAGYGYTFQHAGFQNWGPGPGDDMLAMSDALAPESWIDPQRQVVLGHGYGGYLTTWILTQNQRFKAAVAVDGIPDLIAFSIAAGTGSLARQFGGFPWEPEVHRLLDAQSPLTPLDGLRTPLLLVRNNAGPAANGTPDEPLYRSLQQLNRPADCIRYPQTGENRGLNPTQRLDQLVRFDEFFQRFIGNPAQPNPPAAPAPIKPAAPVSK
ncbi:MAG: S9 family peptidase [Verrucomicrobia bacterium]|nr:S9 family peptidase [Verrucomicrobiota bacterium]